MRAPASSGTTACGSMGSGAEAAPSADAPPPGNPMTPSNDALLRPGTAMKFRPLGRTGLMVSSLSFGASSLGGVFRPVDEQEGIRAVHVALDLGINYFDVAPAYGGTRAETLLGRALRGVPRGRYYLSTKVGKYTSSGGYGDDSFDYSRARIRASLDESAG